MRWLYRDPYLGWLGGAAAIGICLTFVVDSGLVRWSTFALLLLLFVRLWGRAQVDHNFHGRLGENGRFHVVVEDLGAERYDTVRLLRLHAGGASSRYMTIRRDSPMDVGATESLEDADFVVSQLASVGATARREDRRP